MKREELATPAKFLPVENSSSLENRGLVGQNGSYTCHAKAIRKSVPRNSEGNDAWRTPLASR